MTIMDFLFDNMTLMKTLSSSTWFRKKVNRTSHSIARERAIKSIERVLGMVKKCFQASTNWYA